MNLDLARLAIAGNRGSRRRLLAIAAGVAIGVAILLVLWGASGGLRERDERNAWTQVWTAPKALDGGLNENRVLASQGYDYFRGERITRVDVAVLSETTVAFPGGITPPAPGEYYVSSALAELIDAAPADELGDRYGSRAGILPDEALIGPGALVVLVGHDSASPTAAQFDVLDEFNPVGRGDNEAYQTILVIGGIAVFFPVVLFISIVTQLGAAQRQESFATLRLIGASPKAVVGIAVVEMAVTSLVGAIAGIGLAWLVRPLAAMVPIDGETSFASDFAVSPAVTLLVVVAMVLVSTLAAAWRVHRAGIGPLGGSRQLREGHPSWLRVLPVAAGLGTMLLAATSLETGLLPNALLGLALILGFTLTCVGIVTIGPWLTWQLSRVVARFARSAESVIASSRILATPAATFRSVGGLVVAVFLVTVFAGSASVVSQSVTPREQPGLMPVDMLTVNVGNTGALPDVIETLERTEGVTGVIQVHMTDPESGFAGMAAVTRADAVALGFDDVPNAEWVVFSHFAFTSAELDGPPGIEAIPVDDVREPERLYIGTDGSQGAIERARTAMAVATEGANVAMTRADLVDFGTTRLVNSLAVLAYLGIFFSVTIAGISLAVATVAAMLDRKRVLGLMRLMGMPAGSIRRIIGLEAAVPLLAVLGGSIALGFAVAWMIVALTGAGDYQMGWPDPFYFVTLAISLALAVLAIAAGSTTVNRHTSLSATRFE